MEASLLKGKKKILLSIIAVSFAIWVFWGNVTIGTTHYRIVSDKIPSSFNHYKIVVVSDLHNAEFGKDNSRLIRLIEKEKPDMIAITGDFIDSDRTDIGTVERLVQKLVEIAPCYYVTGNHEAWSGEQYQELEKFLLDESVVVLRNESVTLTKDHETIQLAGLDDPDFPNKTASLSLHTTEAKLNNMNLTDDYCILLAHRPEDFKTYADLGIDLVLSGHTHGGQFRIPLIGGIVAPNQGLFPKYDAGLYTENNTTMIISRGIGNSVVPIRFNNRPELISVELICEE